MYCLDCLLKSTFLLSPSIPGTDSYQEFEEKRSSTSISFVPSCSDRTRIEAEKSVGQVVDRAVQWIVRRLVTIHILNKNIFLRVLARDGRQCVSQNILIISR